MSKKFVKKHFGHYYSRRAKAIKVGRIIVAPIRKAFEYVAKFVKFLYNKI